MNTRPHTQNDGIALLITLIIMTVLLGVSASLLNISLKQYQIASVAVSSEIAFQAATAALDCALEHDYLSDGTSEFDVKDTPVDEKQNVACMGDTSNDEALDANTTVMSGEEQLFQFIWGSPQVCSEVSVYKFYSSTNPVDVVVNGVTLRSPCGVGAVCTVFKARGYNDLCGSFNKRTVEREITRVY